jgi:hypothetical protein
MSIAFVQALAAAGTSTQVTTFTTSAFGAGPTPGNTIIVCVWYYSAATPTMSIDDSTGLNTAKWTQDKTTVIGGLLYCDIWRASNIAYVSGSYTLTATAIAASYISVTAAEFSGLLNVSPLDGAGGSDGNATTGNPDTGTFSTTNANDLLIATFGNGTTSAVNTRPYPNVIGTLASNGTDIDGEAVYAIVSSTQSNINPAWTITPGTHIWAGLGVAYKAAAGGATPTLGRTFAAGVLTPQSLIKTGALAGGMVLTA